MSLQQALDFADKRSVEAELPGPAAAIPSGALLTPREHQVASLIARGLSNRLIAEQLVITERTVGAHVEHILDKLSFTSRTQIGVWAAEQERIGHPATL